MKNVIALMAGLAVIGAAAAAVSIVVNKKKKASESESLIDFCDEEEVLDSRDDSEEGYIGYEGFEGDMKGIPFFSRLLHRAHHASEEAQEAEKIAQDAKDDLMLEKLKAEGIELEKLTRLEAELKALEEAERRGEIGLEEDCDEERPIEGQATIEELIQELKEPTQE